MIQSMHFSVQRSVEESRYPAVPSTEGIKYTGSKLKLLPYILFLADKTKSRTIFDGFSGTTRVSQALAHCGHRVICNDQAIWSEYFGTCYLKAGRAASYAQLIDHLNACKPIDGWFTENYGGTASSLSKKETPKRPWQIHNTRKLDAIREEIDTLSLSVKEKAVAITSLILALDQVDNTLGHFSSYLRQWSPRSYNDLVLKVPNTVESHENHAVLRNDIFDIVANIDADLAYYDPPYGSNNEKMPPSRVRYSAYYHVWTTICLNDKPGLFGRVNRREDSRDTVAASVFEEFRKNESGKFIAVDAIHRLLKSTRARYIILSYSSGGRATATELYHAMNAVGTVEDFLKIDYKKNVMAEMRWTNEWLRDAACPNSEFLFLIKRK